MTIKKLKFSQIIIDFILILISFTLAYFLRVGFIFSTDFPFDFYAMVFVPTAFAWILILLLQDVYTIKPIAKREIFTKIIAANLIGVTIFVLIFFYKRDIFFSRLILVYSWTISNILLITNAWLFRILKYRLFKKGIGTKKTLVVGTNQTAEKIIQDIKKHEPYYEVVAILDAYGSKKKDILGVPVLGKMNSLEEVVDEYEIEVILQADCIEQSLNLVHFCEDNSLEYFLAPSLFGSYHQNIGAEMIGKRPLIVIRN